ncbi:MAG: HAMP domain-containing sensor histidine kinase [Spirochaetia bacterium]|jgi:signal transduction histidine kinase
MIDEDFLKRQPEQLLQSLNLLPQEVVFIRKDYTIFRMNTAKIKQHPKLRPGMKCYEAFGFHNVCDFCLAGQAEKIGSYIKNPVCVMTGKKKNKPRHINIIIDVLCGPDKQIYGFIEIIDNVEALYQSHDQLEYLNKEYESVIYALSHDLRSPLISIEGFLRKLKKSRQNPDASDIFDHCLGRIHANVEAMNNLVNVLLDTSRIITGKLDLQEVDMETFLEHLAEDIRIHAAERNVKIEMKGNFGIELCDKIRIRQVFSNLIDNAIKHSGGADNLTIEMGTDGVIYWVKDNGPGMAPEIKNKVFDPFIQSTKTDGNSFGMGMNIVHKIIQKHNGDIWVESEEGKGTTVYFSLKPEQPE